MGTPYKRPRTEEASWIRGKTSSLLPEGISQMLQTRCIKIYMKNAKSHKYCTLKECHLLECTLISSLSCLQFCFFIKGHNNFIYIRISVRHSNGRTRGVVFCFSELLVLDWPVIHQCGIKWWSAGIIAASGLFCCHRT